MFSFGGIIGFSKKFLILRKETQCYFFLISKDKRKHSSNNRTGKGNRAGRPLDGIFRPVALGGPRPPPGQACEEAPGCPLCRCPRLRSADASCAHFSLPLDEQCCVIGQACQAFFARPCLSLGRSGDGPCLCPSWALSIAPPRLAAVALSCCVWAGGASSCVSLSARTGQPPAPPPPRGQETSAAATLKTVGKFQTALQMRSSPADPGWLVVWWSPLGVNANEPWQCEAAGGFWASTPHHSHPQAADPVWELQLSVAMHQP